MKYYVWKVLAMLYFLDCVLSEIKNGDKIMNKIKNVARRTSNNTNPIKKTAAPAKPSSRVEIVERNKEVNTRRHLETNSSQEIVYPKHIDDLLYYVTTAPPYYTAGTVRAEQIQREARPSDPCDDIYRDMLLRDISSVDTSLSLFSKESKEMNPDPKETGDYKENKHKK